ncbi:MAG: LacI family DNA-binding transcriptional regulator [Anaerolineae bacterium]|nr:LacI family DNA-binding transcriptional regulator [Anaerolineae bacterium]
MSNRITIGDVAKKAQVSMMTVSRVINNKDDVSPATRQRVLQAVEALGYRPSGIARGLATQHTGTLGLVVPDIANPFFAEVARGVEHGAHEKGYNVFLCNTEEDQGREIAVLQSLEEKWVDGIILCSSRLDNETLIKVTHSHPAVVLVNRRLEANPGSAGSVLVDDIAGSRLVTQHLLNTGHRTISFLAGPAGSHSSQWRIRGYRESLAAAGIVPDPDWIRYCAPVVEAGFTAARALLTAHPASTALLCYNDLVAVGALKACAELGAQVPIDVAVAGFDDIPLAALVTPTLTTCHIPRYALGTRAVALLLDHISQPNLDPQEIILQPHLIVRASAPEKKP